jgi:hypothetical protein
MSEIMQTACHWHVYCSVARVSLKNVNWRAKARSLYQYAEKVPPVLRSLLGIVLIGLGVLGFLPFLGFWMVPLGALFIALDVPPWRKRVDRWLEERQ